MGKLTDLNNLDKLSKALDARYKELIDEEKARAIAEEQALQSEINITKEMFGGKSIRYVTQVEYDALTEDERNSDTVTYFITDAVDLSHEHENKEFLDGLSQEVLDVEYVKAVDYDGGEVYFDYSHNNDYFIYGINNITKHLSTLGLKINTIGDSIGAGTAAESNHGFIYQFTESYIIENNLERIKLSTFNKSNLTAGQSGLGLLNRILSSGLSFNIYDFAWIIPQYDYQLQIVYSTRVEGGSFNIYSNDVLLQTYSCNGDEVDGLETDWMDISAGSNVTISNTSEQDSYLNFYRIRKKEYNESNTLYLHGFNTGGLKVADYPNDEILFKSCFYDNPDILIWEIGSNDYSSGTIDVYEEYLEKVLIKARDNGVQVIIITPIRNEAADIDDNITKTRFETYRNINLDMAKKYNCCHIDYDTLFGGFNKAKEEGLIADTIHPNDYGHKLMADTLCKIFNTTNCYSRGIQNNYLDTRYNYEFLNIDKQLLLTNDVICNNLQAKLTDNNGNQLYRYITPTYMHYTVATLPKYARRGTIAIIENGIYVNSTDCTDSFNVQATWRPIIAIASSTSNRPTANLLTGSLLFDTTLNKLLVWRSGSWKDIFGNDDDTIYIKKSDYDAKIAELEERISLLENNNNN